VLSLFSSIPDPYPVDLLVVTIRNVSSHGQMFAARQQSPGRKLLAYTKNLSSPEKSVC
jgi:hypothetical protein